MSISHISIDDVNKTICVFIYHFSEFQYTISIASKQLLRMALGSEEGKRFFVAVHVGAGYHSPSNEKALRSAMNRACRAAASLLSNGGKCMDAVVAAIQVLEVSLFLYFNHSLFKFNFETYYLTHVLKDDPITNAGRGSNLTEDGSVECDASIMDGKSASFGAVGALPGYLLLNFYLHTIKFRYTFFPPLQLLIKHVFNKLFSNMLKKQLIFKSFYDKLIVMR